MMKKTLLITMMLIFAAAGTANAQMQSGSGNGPSDGVTPGARMIEELGLDEYQAEMIAIILEEARVLHQEVRDLTLQMHNEIKTEAHADVADLLTEDQLLRFEELQLLRAERWGGEQGRGQGNRDGQRGSGDGTCTDDGPQGSGDSTCDGTGTGGPNGGNGGTGNGTGDCTGTQDCGG